MHGLCANPQALREMAQIARRVLSCVDWRQLPNGVLTSYPAVAGPNDNQCKLRGKKVLGR